MLQRALKKHNISPTSYLGLVLLHVFIGLAIFTFEGFSKLYYFAFLVFFAYLIVKNRNRNHEVLYACAYVVGSEVFVRMTGGAIFYEAAKYEVMAFCMIGMLYEGFSKNGVGFFIYLLLLAPGILVSSETLGFDTNIRTAIAFNLSGPVTLGIAALYAYKKKVTRFQLSNIGLAAFLPLISTAVYLFLYTPSLRDIVTNTESNFQASGGFGPNQVATLIGLGIFLAFSRLLFHSQNPLLLGVNIFLFALMGFRGLVTLSRGGIYTGLAMCLLLMFSVAIRSNAKVRSQLVVFVLIVSFAGFTTWLYSSYQTRGLLDLRYASKDVAGRSDKDISTGRIVLFSTEIEAFKEHPFVGIGVGKNKEYREQETGIESASHNEISRLLAEHGILGIIAMSILFFTPLIYRIKNRKNFYFLSYLAFWFLTINHSSMRLAAPAFIYALSLLDVQEELRVKN
ncbi:MAG: O-antigen ligase family protein [Flavobacteriaceae bacterium]|nr:O-antigen ligase family protein [Flavobacteriaceae bacterium]